MTETNGKPGRPGRRDEDAAGTIPQLTSQFYITLRARLAHVDRDALADEHSKRQYDLIVALLDEEETWSNAYEIEQRLIQIVHEHALRVEAARRVVEVTRTLPYLAVHYTKEIEQADDRMRRATTARMVDDLQWHYQQAELKDRFRRLATQNAGWVLMAAVVVFLLVYFSTSHELLIAIFAGMLGAAFSWIVKLSDRLQKSGFSELKLLRNWPFAIPRLSVGIGGATILFFLLKAGALSGSLFPRFERRPDPQGVACAINRLIEAERSRPGAADEGEEGARQGEPESEKAGEAETAASEIVASHLDCLLKLLALGDIGDEALKLEIRTLVQELPRIEAPDVIAEKVHRLMVHERRVSPLRLDGSSLALLILWSVLAGFSERLVPTLLQRKADEATGGKDDKGGAGGAAPTPTPTPAGPGKPGGLPTPTPPPPTTPPTAATPGGSPPAPSAGQSPAPPVTGPASQDPGQAPDADAPKGPKPG